MTTHTHTQSEDVAKERVARGQVYRCCCFSSARHVPYLLVAADLMSGIASGMTIKFFPLWLEQIVGLAPMQLNGVGAGQFLSIAVGVACAQRVARRVGRVQVMLGVKFASFCVFASMIAGEGKSVLRCGDTHSLVARGNTTCREVLEHSGVDCHATCRAIGAVQCWVRARARAVVWCGCADAPDICRVLQWRVITVDSIRLCR